MDGVAYQVRKGDAIYVPGDALHTLKNHAADLLKILYAFPASSLSEVQYKFPDGKERRLVAGENVGGQEGKSHLAPFFTGRVRDG